MSRRNDSENETGPLEIAFVGDMTEHENDMTERVLDVPLGGTCTIYFDSPGGSPYCAMALTTLIMARRLNCTAVVTGECSSAALWPFAACKRRVVTPYSVLLFHPMKWQSEERVMFTEASEWARHFAQLEQQMDTLLARLFGAEPDMLAEWVHPGRYVSGRELAAAGLAELVDLPDLPRLHHETQPPPRSEKSRR